MYGLLNTGLGVLTTTKADTPEKVATIMLALKMKEDGIEYTKENRQIFIQGWAKHMNENFFDERDDHKAEEIADEVADNIIYNNAPHIINLKNRREVNDDFKEKVFSRIVELLTF